MRRCPSSCPNLVLPQDAAAHLVLALLVGNVLAHPLQPFGIAPPQLHLRSLNGAWRDEPIRAMVQQRLPHPWRGLEVGVRVWEEVADVFVKDRAAAPFWGHVAWLVVLGDVRDELVNETQVVCGECCQRRWWCMWCMWRVMGCVVCLLRPPPLNAEVAAEVRHSAVEGGVCVGRVCCTFRQSLRKRWRHNVRRQRNSSSSSSSVQL